MSRRDEIAQNLAVVDARISRACEAAGRAREEVRLIVVTKTFPASDIVLLHELGVTDIGENRHPEAEHKRSELGPAGDSLTWHFVGGLQSNKAAAIAAYADTVHSLDRAKVVDALSRGAVRAERVVDCLVQVNLEGRADDPYGRAGADPADVEALATRVEDSDGLRLRGVMAVAPLATDPAPAFTVLGEIAGDLARAHPAATLISAGMSGDLEAAVQAGATHVRIGRSVLGDRPAVG